MRLKLYYIDYYSKGCYKVKIVEAKTYEQAIKKARLKEIEEIREVNTKHFSKESIERITADFNKSKAELKAIKNELKTSGTVTL